MDIKLVPCYSDRALFLQMAKRYVDTLHEFDERIRWDEPTWESQVWHSLFILEDRTIQGFVLPEEVNYKIFRDLLYIEEIYIEPEARHRGVGAGAVKELTKHWHGDVFLYILNHNYAAKGFWASVERKFGWKRIKRPEIREEDGCELLVYEINTGDV